MCACRCVCVRACMFGYVSELVLARVSARVFFVCVCVRVCACMCVCAYV